MSIPMIPLLSFVLITTFTPGPNNISSASMGISYGYRKTFRYLVGITAGFFLVMLCCATLSHLLLQLLPAAEGYLRIIGALYICWLALAIFRSNGSLGQSGEISQPIPYRSTNIT